MIRKYTSKDRKNVIELLQLNTPDFFAKSEEKDFIKYLSYNADNYFVAVEAGSIIGCGGINFGFDNGSTARISWDMIHPDYRGKGIGSKLTKYRIDQIKRIKEINKIIVRSSQLAYQFYQKLGFELEFIEKNYWAKGFDLYQLKLEL